ncbi:uncharacterized protein LOC127627091 [Xyrauchen texanus]|uniref:uncharacterized protein LOC127627091 n=1 Tax=Xyrauchen texanus TaxID=154827 RepID=UPI00224283A4|nr:uncharacterized protein LOC127627091 [Xyrauchen texanus]
MLVDKQKLFHPPEMDACIRGGQWLNLSTLWDTNPTWERRPCFSEIKRGSYFPGTGIAIFKTSDLPELKTEEACIKIEIFGSWTGTTLSFQSTGFQYVLRREAQLGLKEGSETASLPHEPAPFTVNILKHAFVVNSKAGLETESLDFFSMWKKGMLLALGGVPDEREATKVYITCEDVWRKYLSKSRSLILIRHCTNTHQCNLTAVLQKQ